MFVKRSEFREMQEKMSLMKNNVDELEEKVWNIKHPFGLLTFCYNFFGMKSVHFRYEYKSECSLLDDVYIGSKILYFVKKIHNDSFIIKIIESKQDNFNITSYFVAPNLVRQIDTGSLSIEKWDAEGEVV